MSSSVPTSTCPRCGADIVQPPGRGRRRIWCSDACRRRGSEERQAADRGAIAVRIIERETEQVHVKRVRVEPSLDECVQRVASSPAAVRKLFQKLYATHATTGGLRGPQWDGALHALARLVTLFDR